MTILEFEQKHNVRLILKTESKFMRLIGLILGRKFRESFWTTYRLPFQKLSTITYTAKSGDPMQYKSTLSHELIHVKLLDKWYGPLLGGLLVSLVPLPVLFSGRWYIERYAYLDGILNYNYDIDGVVNLLWNGYGWPWPKPLMKRWFLRKIKEHKEKSND